MTYSVLNKHMIAAFRAAAAAAAAAGAHLAGACAMNPASIQWQACACCIRGNQLVTDLHAALTRICNTPSYTCQQQCMCCFKRLVTHKRPTG
jgi:hypothetical protein